MEKVKKITSKKNKPKKDPYLLYKLLTKYIVSGDNYQLEYICRDKSKSKTLRSRSITYFYGFPKLMWYINKYLNNLFDQSKWSDEEWFKICYKIASLYGLSNTNQLFFSKYKANEYADFVKLIKDYYDQLGLEEVSKGDIEAFYTLYVNGKISIKQLDDMELIIKGEDTSKSSSKSKSSSNKFNIPISNNLKDHNSENRIFDDLAPNMQSFSNQVKEYIKTNKQCYGCKLKSGIPIILDSNLETPGPVDILVINSSPGYDDIDTNIPLSGASGMLFKDPFYKLVNKYNLKYVIINTVLCYNKEQIDIKFNDNMKNCSENISLLKSQFPSKLTILIGDKSLKSAGIKGGITKLNGSLVEGQFIMISPKSALESNRNKQSFDNAIIDLNKVISEKWNTSTNNISEIDNFRISQDSIVTRITSQLTLFDIKQLGNKIVYILKDIDGNKKYYIEDIRIPIYIKNGIYKDCPNITNSVEYYLSISSNEKDILNKKLYADMKKLIDY